MNTPNPLVPQGSLQPGKKSTVRVAILTIVAVHAFVFAGILMQSGCKPESTAKNPDITTDPPRANEDLAKLDTNRFYDPLPSTLPAETNVSAFGTNWNASQPLASQPLSPPTPSAIPVIPVVAFPLVEPAVPETKDYIIAKGDILLRVARAHRVTIGQILDANPGLAANKLKIGQTIKIPVSATASPAGIGLAEPAGLVAPKEAYVVKKGDSLMKIASQHGVTVKALKAANDLKTDTIQVNKKLTIPAKPAGAAAPAPVAP